MKGETTNHGAAARDVQRTVVAAGGVKIGKCRVADDSGRAGNIAAVRRVIVVECEIADGGAGAVDAHLGLSGNGGCEHCSGENEFDQSFHIFDIVVFLFWCPAIGQPSPLSSQLPTAFLQLLDALTAEVILGNLTR